MLESNTLAYCTKTINYGHKTFTRQVLRSDEGIVTNELAEEGVRGTVGAVVIDKGQSVGGNAIQGSLTEQKVSVRLTSFN